MISSKASARGEAGFTLLEVIIALGILAIGVSSAFSLFAAATAAQKRAIDRTHAAAIAEHTIADIESAWARGIEAEDLLARPPLAEIERNWPGYQVDIGLRAVGDSDDRLLVDVSVYWKVQGENRKEKFRQILVRSIGKK